jgi:hypothetical protein
MMFDGRSPPRRDDITSARSHPELSLGYLAMRPRIDVRLPPAEHGSVGRRSRRMLGVCAAIAAVTLAVPLLQGWMRLACLDYQAIMRGAPALSERWAPSAFECPAPGGESVADVVQRFAPTRTMTASRP